MLLLALGGRSEGSSRNQKSQQNQLLPGSPPALQHEWRVGNKSPTNTGNKYSLMLTTPTTTPHYLRSLFVEMIDSLFPQFSPDGAVQPLEGIPLPGEVLGHDVQHTDHLREDENTAAHPPQPGEELVQ